MPVCKRHSLFQRNGHVGAACHLDFKARAKKFFTRRQCHIKREGLFVAPMIRRAGIGPAVPRIEDHGFDLLRFLQATRAQNRLDDFAHVHRRDDGIVAIVRDWEVSEKSEAVYVNLARPDFGAQPAAVAVQRYAAAHPCVFGKLIKLRDVRERHIIAILLPDHRPFPAERGRSLQHRDDKKEFPGLHVR